MKITERLIERKNNGRPVQLNLLKKLLATVPVFDFPSLKEKTIDSLHIKGGVSNYGGTVFSLSVDSTDLDGNQHTNNLPIDINDQLSKFKEAELKPLTEKINSLTEKVNQLESEVKK